MDGIVVATLIFSGAAALFSAIGVLLSVNSQQVATKAATRLEEKNEAWTPPSLPQ